MTARRARISILLLILGLIGSKFVVPVGAAPAARRLAVTPATGLENQAVKVSWSGFDPTYTVTIYQCKSAQPKSLSDCYRDLAGVTDFGTGTDQAITGPDGTGSASFEVRPATQLPVLGCSSKNNCSILAFENDGTDLPTTGLPSTAAVAPLDFAPSPSDCPTVSTPDVTTEGEGSTSHALYSWSARVCTGRDPLSLDYTESSSPAGRFDFLKGLVDVGLTSTAPTGDEIAAGTKRPFVAAPIDLTGVVVAFNVFDTVTHDRITNMNLTPRLVAILIAGGQSAGPGQSLFTDPEFVALNPGHSWPERTVPPLLRSERNADAYVLTNWLNSDTAARRFLDGKDPTAEVDSYWKGIAYPTDVFEARDPSTIGGYNPRSGTLTIARLLFNFQLADASLGSPQHEGLMGVMDAVTANKFGFTTARLLPANARSKAGFVAADSAGLTAGYHAMTTTGDKVTRVANSSAPGAYPLVKIDYALVPTSGETKAKTRDIARFLDFAAGGGQAAGVLSGGYVPMPADLRAQTAVAQRLVTQGRGAPPAGTTRPTVPPTTPSKLQPAVPGSGNGAGALPGDVAPSGSFGDGGTPSGGGEFSDTPSDSSGLGGSDSGGASLGDSVAGSDSPTGTSTDPSAPRSTPTAPNQTTDGGTQNEVAQTATIRPIGKFVGPDGQQVLPLLLGSGVAALTVGPGLSLWVRRKNKQRAKLRVEAATP